MLELGLVGLQMRALRHLEGAVGRANGGENHCAVKMCVRKKKDYKRNEENKRYHVDNLKRDCLEGCPLHMNLQTY